MEAMNAIRRAGWPALVVTLAAVILAAAAASCSSSETTCELCGRHEYSAVAFRIEYKDGSQVHACCPRCASHLLATKKGDKDVARLIAHDFPTGKEIDARSAVYVDGSDYMHCHAPMEERTEPASVGTLTYDRCLPSLVAFATASEAETFQREHGGTVKAFADLDFGKD
ncbi:MAG TPA: hypothetical protein VNI57_12265 [Candidatus Saccharimonadales bacterium]|nr:hypothetical protein [Candidatus Saccharimonadales bacterium]